MNDFLTAIPYNSENYVVLDFETTNINKGSALSEENSIVLSVLYEHTADNETTTVHWGNEYSLRDIISKIEAADFMVAHNAKFELQWLARAGLNLSTVRVYDTLLGEYVLYAGLSNVGLGLGVVAERYGHPNKEPYIDMCIKKGICPSTLPKSLLERRCIYDVNVTHKIFLAQREILLKEKLLPSLWTRCILSPVLAAIEPTGMCLDKERVTDLYTATIKEFNVIEQQLSELTGGINLNSAPQRAAFIYDTLGVAELTDKKKNPIRTSKDGRKTDQGTLLCLKGKNKEQKDFLAVYSRYAYLNAKLTKSLNTYKAVIDNDDILQAQFNQSRTTTQRLSSSGLKYSIQFQNQAREFKPMFRARTEGWLVGEIDGAQLEFRVAAFLGQDVVAVRDIENGFDVHSYTAAVMTEAGQKTDRQGAKSHTFKPLFGGSSGTKAEQKYYEDFKAKYVGITAAQEKWINEALVNQKVRTVTGLQYHYPGTKYQGRGGYVINTTQICNYPVQGFATADIIPIALTYMWHSMQSAKLRSFIVNTIHDSVVMEIHPDEVDIVREIGVKCFTECVYNYLKLVYNIEFNVPLGTGFKAGKYWTEGKEIVESIAPPYKLEATQ